MLLKERRKKYLKIIYSAKNSSQKTLPTKVPFLIYHIKIFFTKINMPYEEKIITSDKKYKENLPSQSSKVKPTRIIENNIKKSITLTEKLFFGLFKNP
jgi:hypothetical protein